MYINLCSVSESTNLVYLIVNDRIIFHHLQLGIAPAIPASNEWKKRTNNSAAHELKVVYANNV